MILHKSPTLTRVLVLVISYISLIYLFVFKVARLDFDPYHDGFIFPPALVVAEGGMPNRNAFSLYGPLSPIIQGNWLRVLGNDAITLRIHGVFLLMVIFTLLLILLSRFISFYLALLISSIWILSNPLIVQPSLPWPDLYVCIIQLFVLTLTVNRRFQESTWFYFVLGFLSGSAIFFKINFSLSFLFALMLMFVFRIAYVQILKFGIGGLTSVCIAILLMSHFGIIKGYFYQTIKYSFLMHDQDRDLRGLFNLKILIFGILFFLVFSLIEKHSFRDSKVKSLLVPFALTLTIQLVAVSKYRKLSEPFFSAGVDFSKNIQLIMKWLPYSPMFAVFFFVFIELVRTIITKEARNPSYGLIFLLSTTELIRLYPSPEPGHMWYMFPVLSVGFFSAPRIREKINKLQIPFAGIALATLVSAVCIMSNYISISRVDFQSSFLQGMKGDRNTVQVIDATVKELNSKGYPGQIDFRCLLGVYSVASGKLMSVDFHYANLPHDIFERPKARQIFVCGDISGEELQIPKKVKVLFNLPGVFPNTRNILFEILE